MTNNKINQEVQLTPFDLESREETALLLETKWQMNADLINFIKNMSPITEKRIDGGIVLSREIFIFTREELKEFINQYNENKKL